MKKYIYEAKSYEEAKNRALNDLKIDEENIIIHILEEKQGLLKKNIKLEIITISEIIAYLKETVSKILNLMNIEANLEIRKQEKNIEINIFSNNNSILIGKEGKTLDSIQNIISQIVLKELGDKYKITVDVENYKEHRITNIERTARRVAREVAKTKLETKLDTMNSYERRIVHNTLSNNKYVYTESVGEEPNRCVMIKPKEGFFVK